MCHGQLTMSFGDRVNFIVGQNGSGKSAILNALQAVFGSSARATSRQSVKDWIRTENNGRMKHADVIISLNNLYKDRPYEYDLYGDTITIKRHITSSSSSKLYSRNLPTNDNGWRDKNRGKYSWPSPLGPSTNPDQVLLDERENIFHHSYFSG